jgi:nucleotide-binding universal stress UspA family protein
MRTEGRAGTSAVPHAAGKRVLVLFEAGRSGVAAVELAREMASRANALVTVVSVAPQAPPLRGCAPSARDYNATVRDTVAEELEQAEQLLWVIGDRAQCRLLVEGKDPPIEEVVSREGFDLVLLPGRRRLLRGVGHPAAGHLRANAATEVLIVDPEGRHASPRGVGAGGSGSLRRVRRR